ncbi:hypothetical protein SND99_18150, partial [Escherichia coli]|nr:hypothetical protein [Escherichia coli]
GGTADRNRSHWSTSKTPSYTKSVSWQHHLRLINLTRASDNIDHSQNISYLDIILDPSSAIAA